MKKFRKWVFSPPSIRLNTLVVCEIVLLLVVSLGTLFLFARQSLVEEAKMDAEQKLQGTQQCIDNILLEVEQSAGNIYYDLLEHLDNPESMQAYCQHVVLSNKYIDGCAIAFKPGYYPDREFFMAYVRRDELKGLVAGKSFGHRVYTKQNWYLEPMKNCKPTWLNPVGPEEADEKPIISFCIPITPDGNEECIGVLAVDLQLETLSQRVLAYNYGDKSYCLLIDGDGSFIVSPNKTELLTQTVYSLADKYESETLKAVGKQMLEGNSGNTSFKLHGSTWYAFYKPFERHNIPGRSMEELHWSIANVYPKGAIFDEYNHHISHIFTICTVGLLLFYIFSRFTIRKQLKPLRRLTESALSMAEGNYATMVPDTQRKDEIGQFQQHFKRMQDSLTADIQEQEQLTETLNKRRDELRKVHQQIEEDNRVQTTLLHNVTNRMIPPTESIVASVDKLCDNYQEISKEEVNKEVSNIREQSDTILELLKKKFDISYAEETGKEESHE